MKASTLILTMVLATSLLHAANAQSFYRPPSPELSFSAFGGAVAIGEQDVFIGEPQGFHNPGRVHVFSRSLDRGWMERAALHAADGKVGDGFGQAIASKENVLLVGTSRANNHKGAVYVFEQDEQSGGWIQQQSLSSADAAPGDGLGSAISYDGSTALIGAADHDGRSGTVYVFQHGTDGRLAEMGRLTPTEPVDGARFGSAIAVHGYIALVGAPLEEQGVVYAFRRDESTGIWVEEARISGADVDVDRTFGAMLRLDGNRAIVGSPRARDGSGTVHVFSRDATTGSWMFEAELTPAVPEERAQFGAAIDVSDDTVWIGVPGAGESTGAVAPFVHDPAAGWVEQSRWTLPDLAPRDFFGNSFAVKGNVAVVGVTGDDYGEGTARIFERGSDGAWTPTASLLSDDVGPMPAIAGGQVDCDDGLAASFVCSDVDLVSFVPLREMGVESRGVRLNDVWGWTDPETRKEYAIVGSLEAAAFIDVSDPENPVYLGQLLRTEGSPGSTWRDIKVYKNHAFIVADGARNHGMQVFDLTQLRDVRNPPVTFQVTAHYDGIASAHNIVINEETGFAYTVGNSSGGETCGGGLHMIDIRTPTAPTFVGCFADRTTGRSGTGATHDAQCVNYTGPDVEHRGKEICIGSNGTAISIADVSDKGRPVPISTGSYPDYAYIHQGWLTDDQRYFFQNDEGDEIGGKVERTRTLVWDLADLDDPIMIAEYYGPESATDHNLYVKGDLMYQTNNASGLRIIDVSNPEVPVEVGFFDTTPYGENVSGFNGTWSSYPFFDSGIIVVSSRREGVFVLRKRQVDL